MITRFVFSALTPSDASGGIEDSSGRLKASQNAPETFPRRPQDALKTTPSRPKTPQDASKTPPRRPKGGSKTAPGRSKDGVQAPRTPQGAPKPPQDAPEDDFSPIFGPC